jgi:hypothetical protein
MSTCKYCGQSAGIFSKAHKECEAKHQRGVQAFEATVSSYFTQRLSAATVASTKRQLQIDAYLSFENSRRGNFLWVYKAYSVDVRA